MLATSDHKCINCGACEWYKQVLSILDETGHKELADRLSVFNKLLLDTIGFLKRSMCPVCEAKFEDMVSHGLGDTVGRDLVN